MSSFGGAQVETRKAGALLFEDSKIAGKGGLAAARPTGRDVTSDAITYIRKRLSQFDSHHTKRLFDLGGSEIKGYWFQG